MHAMVMEKPGFHLVDTILPVPRPNPDQVLVQINACGVCRTDLHIFDGELTHPKLQLVLGHEIAGKVVQVGEHVANFRVGERVGVPWLGYTDGTCAYCRRGQENLCDHPEFTGYTLNGGYAEYTVADHRYCFPLPPSYTDTEVAPLLCAGLIGYRTYRLAGENIERVGIYGFGAAAHIIAQVAVYQGKQVYAFTRPGDTATQEFARRLGAVWAGGSDDMPPVLLDAALVFAPVGPLMVSALRATAKGGIVVSGGIHMSDIPAFPYDLLWEERALKSVANLTRQDAIEFLEIAPRVPVKTAIETFPLDQANEALTRLKNGKIEGAGVLVISS
ncbi:MAG: zinc-dependent alcohol dehydrogenase family protein [Chloroflexi bacterium]|nr:zinc-dependent alcohol dehydrogenase family protein [Chloroflexota bacterium]